MERRLLSTWNQIAPRAYIRKWYCFPYRQDGNLEALKKHLKRVLDQLSRHFPELAGRIFLLSRPIGHLCIGLDDCTEIPLKVFDQRDSFGWTYTQLKAQGFPARAFVGNSFDLPYQLLEDQQGIPVLEVHARVIEGGLLLCIYNHHSLSDGSGMDNYISSFAELTRDPSRTLEVQYPVDIHIDLPERRNDDSQLKFTTDMFRELLGLCAEYCHLSSPTGPTQFRILPTGTPLENIPKTGRIFVIGARQISDLKDKLAQAPGADPSSRLPSTFTCLAAITWAHVTKARLSSPTNFLSPSLGETAFPEKVRLMVSVNWRRRAFASIMGSSAGNTVALPIATVDTATILAACISDQDTACAALGIVASSIDTAVLGVDDDFVALRTALIRAAPDPRFLGLDADPRDPRDFYFNTWRQFGPQQRWKMPGLVDEEESGDGLPPDAIRRAQAEWGMGAGLLLPSRENNTAFEVLVTLDVDSMRVLCAEPSWKTWVNEVLE